MCVHALLQTVHGRSNSSSDGRRIAQHETSKQQDNNHPRRLGPINTHATAQMRPTTVAVGMALGLYTFHDTLMPRTCGNHTVK